MTAIVIPLPTQHSSIFKICPICKSKEYIVRSRVFSGEERWNELRSLLYSGRDYTKTWIDNLRDKDKEQALKRLNAVGAYELVKFIALD